MKTFILTLLCLLLMMSCTRQAPTIDEQALFQIKLGLMEDELDIFENRGLIYPELFNFTLQNGFFYIVNASSKRLMKFTNHGDILSLIYNPINNPPFIAQNEDRKITLWNFREPRAISVNSNNDFYLDELANDQQQFDLFKDNIAYDRVILKFDEAGNYLYKIGQDGIDGTNFPFIEKIHSNKNNDLIVITRLLQDWKVFWFDSTGKQKFEPIVYTNNDMVINNDDFSIESIHPDYNKNLLYLVVSPRLSNKNSAKVVVAQPKPLTTIDTFFDVPSADQNYQLVGVDQSSRLYFMSTLPTNNSYLLHVIDNHGNIKRSLNLQSSFTPAAIATQFYLTPEAILSAFVIHNRGAELLWWRLDHLFSHEEKKVD